MLEEESIHDYNEEIYSDQEGILMPLHLVALHDCFDACMKTK